MNDMLFRGRRKDNGEWIEAAVALFEFSESEADVPSAEKVDGTLRKKGSLKCQKDCQN